MAIILYIMRLNIIQVASVIWAKDMGIIKWKCWMLACGNDKCALNRFKNCNILTS